MTIKEETAQLAKSKGLTTAAQKEYFDENGEILCLNCLGETPLHGFAYTQSSLQKLLRDKHSIRVFVEQKVGGDFGFVIYTLNKPELRAGVPWVRNSYFTYHFSSYEDALEAGLVKALDKHLTSV